MPSVPVSKLLRRIHLYLALFLTPWVLLYAISTAVMNHKPRASQPPRWETIRQAPFDAVFPEDASPQTIARQILTSLEMDGAHQASRSKDGAIVIQRNVAVAPVRITYRPAIRELTVERQIVTPTAFLERMHRRRGFQHPYVLDDIWAFIVDLFIAATLFWVVSGVWLWWELKVTRVLGALALATGVALFAFLVGVL